ncbi:MULTISPECIES: hypothetical protein [Stenotrophomonas]|uniref:hypothetical protein n=1 Tax=Stenotrophomonas TaxID=40323 RepID=UPI0025838B4F|nr:MULTISPECIES: hypothetical protein [Stenotrophomonas]MCR1005760.1 hypothetical protein [Stenotrophomonas maltophilia]MCR1570567.1 hypothetical protein [Stenotrophomonas sp.]
MTVILPISNVEKGRDADSDVSYQARKLISQRLPGPWMDRRVQMKRFGRCPSAFVRSDHLIDHVSEIAQEVKIAAKLVEFNGPSDALGGYSFALLVVCVNKVNQLCNSRSVLSEGWVKRCRHDPSADSLFIGFIFQGIRSLPPRNVNGDTDSRDASQSLHPCGPINRFCSGSAVWRLRKDCPSNQSTRAEGHYCDHRPVSIRPSVLHGFPLSLDRILPLGVIA